MQHDDTLLAYLVSAFPGNTENIATEALRHVFDRSDAAREALNDVVQSGVRGINPVNTVRSQLVQQDGAKPDLVGFDDSGKQRVLVEIKFWADLTPRQPNSYINALPDDGPAALVFLVPEGRIQLLWPQLIERLNRDFPDLSETPAERRCIQIGGTQKHLMIVSWGGLLDSMAARIRDYGEVGVETEIRQLRSLAKYADEGAFSPITQGEEFGEDSEVRKRQYQRLVDAATERGIGQGWASRKGLNVTRREHGYGRYLKLHDNMVWFGVNVDEFEKTGESPLWVDCHYIKSGIPAATRRQLGMQDLRWAPIELKHEVEFPEMLDGVVESLRRVADGLGQDH